MGNGVPGARHAVGRSFTDTRHFMPLHITPLGEIGQVAFLRCRGLLFFTFFFLICFLFSLTIFSGGFYVIGGDALTRSTAFDCINIYIQLAGQASYGWGGGYFPVFIFFVRGFLFFLVLLLIFGSYFFLLLFFFLVIIFVFIFLLSFIFILFFFFVFGFCLFLIFRGIFGFFFILGLILIPGFAVLFQNHQDIADLHLVSF